MLAMLPACSWCAPAGADLKVELQARVTSSQNTIKAGAGPNLTTLPAKTGESLVVQCAVLNPEKGTSIPDVTVHVSLTPSGKTLADAIYESALVMVFAPGSHSSADLLIQAPSAGDYVLRVETIGATVKLGKEYFATMGVKVQ